MKPVYTPDVVAPRGISAAVVRVLAMGAGSLRATGNGVVAAKPQQVGLHKEPWVRLSERIFAAGPLALVVVMTAGNGCRIDVPLTSNAVMADDVFPAAGLEYLELVAETP